MKTKAEEEYEKMRQKKQEMLQKLARKTVDAVNECGEASKSVENVKTRLTRKLSRKKLLED